MSGEVNTVPAKEAMIAACLSLTVLADTMENNTKPTINMHIAGDIMYP